MATDGRIVSNLDGTIRVKSTPQLRQFIKETFVTDPNLPARLRDLIDDPNILLEITDLRWLRLRIPIKSMSSILKPEENSDSWLHELMDGSEVQLPEPICLPRDPKLEARVQRLKEEQNTRDYFAMTKNVDCRRHRHPEDTIAYQMKQINRQLIAVAQFVFSVAAGFAFGFIGLELIVGSLDFGFRILLGVMCALIIALAEIYFLAKKLNEEDCHTIYDDPDENSPDRVFSTFSANSPLKPHQD